MAKAIAVNGHSHTIRILVVDDSCRVVAGIGLLLCKQPALTVVAAANSGHDALVQAAWHEPDLVVMDLHMPGMDGMEAATLIRHRHPHVRIIMISVDHDASVQAECLRRGADRFLPKVGLQRRLLEEIAHLFPQLPSNGNRATRHFQTGPHEAPSADDTLHTEKFSEPRKGTYSEDQEKRRNTDRA